MQTAEAVDKEAVRAHVITHGAREAARAFGISENTVLSWSARYGWLTQAGQKQEVQPLPKSMQTAAISAIKPHQAARYSVDNLKSRSRYRLMKGVDKGALAISRWKGDAIAANAQQLNQLASAHAKLCPLDQQSQAPALVQIAISGTAPVAVEHCAGPATTDVVQ